MNQYSHLFANPLNVVVGFSKQNSKIRQDLEDYRKRKSTPKHENKYGAEIAEKN